MHAIRGTRENHVEPCESHPLWFARERDHLRSMRSVVRRLGPEWPQLQRAPYPNRATQRPTAQMAQGTGASSLQHFPPKSCTTLTWCPPCVNAWCSHTSNRPRRWRTYPAPRRRAAKALPLLHLLRSTIVRRDIVHSAGPPRPRPSVQEMSSPRPIPETILPRFRSSTDLHGTRMNSRLFSTSAKRPLARSTRRR
jgi:hypothetical protein